MNENLNLLLLSEELLDISESEEVDLNRVEELINEGADVNFINNEGSISLNSAASRGHKELVELLLDNGANVNCQTQPYGWTALLSAVQSNNRDIVTLLLDRHADPYLKKKNGASVFILAAMHDDTELLSLLYDMYKPDIDEADNNGYTAFMEAAFYGQEKPLRFLYEKGAEVDKRRKAPETKQELRTGGETALMDASKKGHDKIISILVKEMRADINASDNFGRTALIHAFRARPPKNSTIQTLLELGADVTIHGWDQRTPLIMAAEKGDSSLLRLILQQEGIDINIQDSTGKTALHFAVKSENEEMVKSLCEAGADVNCQDNDGCNPFSLTHNYKLKGMLKEYNLKSLRCKQEKYKPISRRHGAKLESLYIEKTQEVQGLRVSMNQDYKLSIMPNRDVYLGFYHKTEVAVKCFLKGSLEARREKQVLHCNRLKMPSLVKYVGAQEDDRYEYICLVLYECNLEEYIQLGEQETGVSSINLSKIVKLVTKALKTLHELNIVHQDLQPSSVLIDQEGNIHLADFDKSEHFPDGSVPKEKTEADLKALGALASYTIRNRKVPYKAEDEMCINKVLQAEELSGVKCTEARDLLWKMSQLDSPMTLEEILHHPFFWSNEEKFKFLQDIGNEEAVKNGEKENDTIKRLNGSCDEVKSFYNWTTKVDQTVWRDMSKRNKKYPYTKDLTSLLKFIRNLGQHFTEKPDEIKDIVQEPGQYFLDLFPDLTVCVYNVVRISEWKHHIPKA